LLIILVFYSVSWTWCIDLYIHACCSSLRKAIEYYYSCYLYLFSIFLYS